MRVVRRAALLAAVVAFVPAPNAGAQDTAIPAADLPTEMLYGTGTLWLSNISTW